MLRTDTVSLAALTTFKVGGTARTVFECATIEEVQTALAYARESGLPWYVLGGGSNVLASDEGYDGVIIRPCMAGIDFAKSEHAESMHEETAHTVLENNSSSSEVLVTAGAGVSWDALVQETVEHGLWGLENLAGIPGTVGAAPVQNIGAYGADIAQTLLYVDVLDTQPVLLSAPGNEHRENFRLIRMTREDCMFGYRDSIFKKSSDSSSSRYIILSVTFLLSKEGTPHTSYADLAARIAIGESLETPKAIADAVRSIRADKFPNLSITGTAGSFFKNVSIKSTEYAVLKQRYPGLPGYPSETDSEQVKVSLAWILDHILNLRGFSNGLAHVRLFERQPLVLVAEKGATAADVNALANEVIKRVFDATGIIIEREVRSL